MGVKCILRKWLFCTNSPCSLGVGFAGVCWGCMCQGMCAGLRAEAACAEGCQEPASWEEQETMRISMLVQELWKERLWRLLMWHEGHIWSALLLSAATSVQQHRLSTRKQADAFPFLMLIQKNYEYNWFVWWLHMLRLFISTYCIKIGSTDLLCLFIFCFSYRVISCEQLKAELSVRGWHPVWEHLSPALHFFSNFFYFCFPATLLVYIVFSYFVSHENGKPGWFTLLCRRALPSPGTAVLCTFWQHYSFGNWFAWPASKEIDEIKSDFALFSWFYAEG